MAHLLRHPISFSGAASVITIGNFDGVHRGHQALLQATLQKAEQLQLPLIIITFEPQPQEFLQYNKVPVRLTPWREKILAIETVLKNAPSYQKIFILTLAFNRTFSELSAEAFVEKNIVQELKAKYILIGTDFHFGKNREGDINFLQNQAKKNRFTVEIFPTLKCGEERVSSTRIRKALTESRLELVADLLGRPYAMVGRVVRGDQRGRMLGFPTANVRLSNAALPLYGVFAVQILGLSSSQLYGVANVGNRPTVDGKKNFLEVYILNFDKDIYGKRVTVKFLKYLRSEKKFNSLDALKEQIAKDVEEWKNLFKREKF